MRKVALLTLMFLSVFVPFVHAGIMDDVIKGIGSSPKEGPDEGTTVSGLKEALAIGTENAVKSVSQVDGYFGNALIKILMPEKLRKVTEVLRKVGFQKQVDEFTLSMNRAAEKAAPRAASIFGDAIRGMTFDDARKILGGGNTAATDFFREKTHDNIYGAFKPIVTSSMDEVGTTRAYKEMMGKYESLPLVSKESFDIDHYVTNKAIDGLFFMVGQEEKKIRTDPAARVTDLLKTVFR